MRLAIFGQVKFVSSLYSPLFIIYRSIRAISIVDILIKKKVAKNTLTHKSLYRTHPDRRQNTLITMSSKEVMSMLGK